MNELIEAYKNTKYKVFEVNLTIEIGKSNQELDAILAKHKANEWAFITAFNPYSRVLTDNENIIRHIELKNLTENFVAYEGHGVGEDPTWEPELSLFIIGISKYEASIIGKKFEQNAIVYGEINSEPELLILNYQFK
jgi:hypothetical protein